MEKKNKKEFRVLTLWFFSLQCSHIYYTCFRSAYILVLSRVCIFQTLYIQIVKINQKAYAEIQIHCSFTLLLSSLFSCLFLLLTILIPFQLWRTRHTIPLPPLHGRFCCLYSWCWLVLPRAKSITARKKESCVNDLQYQLSLHQDLFKREKRQGREGK